MVEVGLNLSHTQIKDMKKEFYKDLVKKKISDCAFEYLQNIKMSHSKVKNIDYSKLELAHYLQDKRFSINEKFTLFKLRSAMSDCLGNFKSRVDNIFCQCDKLSPQTQEHLMKCEIIRDNCEKLRQNNDVVYSDLFRGVERQLPAARLFTAIMDTID